MFKQVLAADFVPLIFFVLGPFWPILGGYLPLPHARYLSGHMYASRQRKVSDNDRVPPQRLAALVAKQKLACGRVAAWACGRVSAAGAYRRAAHVRVRAGVRGLCEDSS